MTDFQAPVDIGNRALQLCGASRVTALTDNSKNAAALNFVYDKLRVVELRRRTWKFAIRNARLRAIDTATTKTLTAAAYAALTAYTLGDIVSYLGRLWLAMGSATGVAPGTPGSIWVTYAGPRTVESHDTTQSYEPGELVYVGATVYMSLISDNQDTPPTANWHVVQGATAAAIAFVEPQSTGARYKYMLPASFLRYAPDPKRGAFGELGGPTGNTYLDYNFEGQYITSSDPSPIMFRFVADIVEVSQFDPMFCEGLACRIALGVVEELTQSGGKLQMLAQEYKTFMGEARIVDAIEVGPAEPDEDEYISVRW